MKHTLIVALLTVCTVFAASQTNAQGTEGLSRQISALRSGMASAVDSINNDLTALKERIKDCGNVPHGKIRTGNNCPNGTEGKRAEQCISGSWEPVLSELFVCEKTYTWVNLINRTESNENACARIGQKPTESKALKCASGEIRFLEGKNVNKINYAYGTWGGHDNYATSDAYRVGHYCYQSGAKRDNDGTDLAVAALCEHPDPGDVIPTPKPVPPYVPPPPPRNER